VSMQGVAAGAAGEMAEGPNPRRPRVPFLLCVPVAMDVSDVEPVGAPMTAGAAD
jgi:hypothetical protein